MMLCTLVILLKKIFRLTDPRALNQILKKVKKVKPGLDSKSLKIKPRSYWQDFKVNIKKLTILNQI